MNNIYIDVFSGISYDELFPIIKDIGFTGFFSGEICANDFEKMSASNGISFCECRADHGGKLGFFGNDEIYGEKVVQGFKNGCCLGDLGQMSAKHDVADVEAAGSEIRHHTDGLKHHIEKTECCIGAGGKVADLAEVGSGHIGGKSELSVFFCDVADAQVYV